MGATLNFSVQSDSHALTDRATWLSFANKFRHRILFEGDPRLFNQYGIVTLDPGSTPGRRTMKAPCALPTGFCRSTARNGSAA